MIRGGASNSRKTRSSQSARKLRQGQTLAGEKAKTSQAPGGTSTDKPKRYLRRSEALDRDPEGTQRDRAGSKESVKKAASTAHSLTHSAPRFLKDGADDDHEPSSVSDAGSSDPVKLLGSQEDSFRADDRRLTALAKQQSEFPDEKEQSEFPDEKKVSLPPVPDEIAEANLEPPDTRTMTSVSREEKDGKTIETFEHEGVTYTQTSDRNGTSLTYQADGVSYEAQTSLYATRVTASVSAPG